MRLCLNCHHLTTGEPLFCNHCGRSYDVKLCSARHINPRSAEFCSQCHSREFSTPAPKTPLWLMPLLWVAKLLPGILLMLLSLMVLIGAAEALPQHPELIRQFLGAGLMVALGWYLYLQLPKSIQQLFQVKRKKRGRGQSGHAGH